MEMFEKMFSLQIVLLIYMFCGFLAAKLKIITPVGRSTLIDLVMDVFMPIMVFRSFLSITLETLMSVWVILVISLVICLSSHFAGKYIYHRLPEDKQDVLHYSTLITNSSFAGLPIVNSLFGAEGLIYASVYIVPMRILLWSAGITIFSGKKASFKELCLKLLKNPNIDAIFVGLFFGLLRIPLPAFLDTPFSVLSSAVTPLSMVVIGSIIAEVPLKHFYDEGIGLYCAVRLMIIPLLAYAVLKLIGVSRLCLGVTMVLTAMPAPTTTAMLAGKYGGNADYASKVIFISMLLSIITVPLIMILL